MGRALKYLLRLAVLAAVALVIYALVADLPPPTRTVEMDLAVPAVNEGADRQAAREIPSQDSTASTATPEVGPE